MATVGSFLASVLTSVGFVHSSRSHAPLVRARRCCARPVVRGGQPARWSPQRVWRYPNALPQLWHYSLLKAGFAIAPAAVVAAVVAAALGRVAGRHRHRVIVLVGALVWAGSLVCVAACRVRATDFLRWLPGAQTAAGHRCRHDIAGVERYSAGRVAKGGSYATSSAVVSTRSPARCGARCREEAE